MVSSEQSQALFEQHVLPEIEVLLAPGTESIIIVHSRDAAGGTFELRRR